MQNFFLKKIIIKNNLIKIFIFFSFIFISTVVAATVIKYNENNLGNSYRRGGWKGTEGLSSSAFSKLMSMNAILRSNKTLSQDKQIGVYSSRRGKKDNSGAGGAKKSKHLTGDAFDLLVPPNKRSEYYAAARQAGFGGFGFKSTTMHVDTRGGFQYWCYGSENGKSNVGKKKFCKGTKKKIAEEYMGKKLSEVSTSGQESPDGEHGDSDTGYEVDLKEGGVRLEKEIKEQLAEICNGSRDYGLVGFDGGICKEYGGDQRSGFVAFVATVQKALNWVIGLAFMIAVMVLFYAGFLLLSGNPNKKSQAKTVLVNVVIGLFLIATAWLLVDWIFTLFGVDDSFKFTSVG